ncbi:MAG TPA: SPOR domain-containing protein [Steroidobacteraceae bacterium]
MDDQLKARLIGAVILVVLAVLLIPELLSGRKAATPEVAAQGAGRGTRTYTIDLTGTGATPAATPTPVPKPQTLPTTQAGPEPTASAPQAEDAPASDPAATRVAPVTAPPPKPPVQTVPAPQPATEKFTPPPPAAEARAAATTVKGGWSVQVGAFGAAGTAGKLVADLKAAGFSAYISPISRGGKTLHRVRVGPEAARADADKLATRLKGRNLPATVVAND